jgi:hypothetical protein
MINKIFNEQVAVNIVVACVIVCVVSGTAIFIQAVICTLMEGCK